MSRYIDENDVYKLVEPSGIARVHCSQIDALPRADVVEVRHGTWYHGNDGGAIYAKCSACGRKMNYSCYGYAYCCLCGARMDGERSEGNENH